MSQSYPRLFIKDNAIVIFGHVLIYMHGIILMPIIIKTVGVTIYGGFVLLLSILSFVFGISSLGIGFKAKRFLPSAGDMTARHELFYPQFIFSLMSIMFLSFFLILFNKPINIYIFKNEISYSVVMIPLYLICYFLYAQGSDYFRYTARVNYMMIATIVLPYVYIGFVLLFFYVMQQKNLNALLLSQIISAFLITIFCFRVIFKEIGIKPTALSGKNIISDIKLGFPLVLNFVVDYVLSSIVRYFIAFYLTVLAVGIFNPAYVLGSLIILIPRAMGTAIPQLLSKAVDNKDEYEAHRIQNYSIKIFLLLAIPFVCGSMILGKPILAELANDEVAEQAYIVTPIVALGTLFYGLNLLLSNVLFVRLKTSIIFRINLFAAVFNILANLVLLHIFRNIIVAGITTFLSYFLMFICIQKVVKKIWSVDYQLFVVGKSIIASLMMLVFLFFISTNMGEKNSVVMLGIELIIGIMVYTGMLFILKTFSSKEISYIKKTFSFA